MTTYTQYSSTNSRGCLSKYRSVRHQQRLLCRAGTSAPSSAPPATVYQSSQQSQASGRVRKLQRHELLRDPAEIGSQGGTTVMVNDRGGDVSLATYMQLPVEQYYILDPSQIQLLSGNTFVLSVPKITLLGASLQPVITVEVTSEPDAVVLQATDCQLNATGIMGGLDAKFAMQFTTKLTWHSGQQQQQQHFQHFAPQIQAQQHQREHNRLANEQQQLRLQQDQQIKVDTAHVAGSKGPRSSDKGTPAPVRVGWDRLRQVGWSRSTPAQQPRSPGVALQGSITGSAVVNVWCEVIPPFHLMPREMLVGTCNTVISGLVNSLLPWFTRQLAADYQKWARDPAYRAARAARSKPAQVSRDGSNN